jgi:Domain of unknown function (DUF4282)
MIQRRSFFDSLFDLSFSSFIATKIAGAVYGIGIGVTGLVGLCWLIVAFTKGFVVGLFALLIVPLVVLLNLILMRMGLESLISTIRTAENTTTIVELSQQNQGMRIP